ncbi:AfsR/SARP family transcriptional regulator [Streptomyces sp. TRM66268-LWL]|uniref:AfsR/SARP family transcriptional regulator n=1 Tax=Streptomyces polyasparticus TaxID=2767826 RepID=A0ABR7SCD9_9ACTN|nr:AfsR/SARP family transcriptional regulator [Streptomyces polyasparticus]MBC9712405.1 AfsR/SARP family transcriptional regulator [Streptomyces polyasparticus]
MDASFRMLGRVRQGDAPAEGAAAEFVGGKARGLLVTLLLQANRMVTMDRVVEALWDGEPPPSAVANVRTHASLLRRHLERGAGLVGAGGGYVLEVAPERCDHLVFLDRAADGRTALRAGDSAKAAELLTSALTLWDGDRAAVGVPRHGPLMGWLGHLEEERLRAVEDLADAYLRLGEPRAALREVNALLAVSPLRDRSWALRMRAHHALGERGSLAETYRAAVLAHHNELGVDPDDQLRRLFEELVAG